MILMNAFRRILLISILAVAFLGVILSHWRLTLLRVESDHTQSIYYVPKASIIRPFLLGHEAFFADLVWIRTLGYFADELMGKGKFQYFEDLINLATDLDPRFEKVYIWAGAIFMYGGGFITEERIYASIHILEKGWKTIQNDTQGWRHNPQYWMIPQMIGFNYAMELGDRKKGAPYIAATARIPGSPDLYKTWAATLYKRAGEIEEGTRVLEQMLAIQTLKSQIETVENKETKEKIRQRLAYYYSKIYGVRGVEKRILRLEREIEQLIGEWKAVYPFVSFDLFLLLRSHPGDALGASEIEDLLDKLFPLSRATSI